MAKKPFYKQPSFIGAVAIIAALAIGFGWIDLSQLGINLPQSTIGPEIEDEQLGEDLAKWKINIEDYYEPTRTVTGTVVLYSPSDPGNPIETLTLSGGAVTTTNVYPEGKQFFVLYYSSSHTWLRYGEVLTMPEINPLPDYTTPMDGGTVRVIKRADSSGATDILGYKGNNKIWDNATASLGGITSGSFNVTGDRSDTDPPELGIRVDNEDDNTAYVDWRGFYDYSVKPEVASLYAQRDSYLVITFEKTDSNSNVSDVRVWAVFEDESGITVYKQDDDVIYMFVPLNTETLAGVRKVVSGVKYLSGNAVIFTEAFNWPSTKSTAIYTDDIDIEIGLVSAFSIAGVEKDLTQDGMELIGEFGSSSSTYGGNAWTNDWSIGDI